MADLNRRQFPAPPEASVRPGYVDRKNTAYENDLVRQDMASWWADEGEDIDADQNWAAAVKRADGNRIKANRSWYYPDGRGQGKLFHDPKPVAEHRWPRGYDPQRQREAGELLSRSTGGSAFNAEQEAWTRDNLARSNADFDPLRWEPEPGKRQGRFIFTVNDKSGSGPLGYFQDSYQRIHVERGRSRGINTGMPPITDTGRRRGDNTAGQVLMHEVGHAVSFAQGTNTYGSPEERGAEEGRADAYAHLNFVPKRRSLPGSMQDNDYLPGPNQAIGQVEKVQFSNAYRAEHHRQGLLSPTERRWERESVLNAEQHKAAMREGIPAHIHENQEMLFRRHGRDLRDPERDYGQHEYYRGDDNPYAAETQPLGSIRIGKGVPEPDLRLLTPKQARQQRR